MIDLAYCPEDAYCEMVATLAKERRQRFEDIAAEFLGRNNRRLQELADLLEDIATISRRWIEP